MFIYLVWMCLKWRAVDRVSDFSRCDALTLRDAIERPHALIKLVTRVCSLFLRVHHRLGPIVEAVKDVVFKR